MCGKSDPEVQVIALKENTGFCTAVNTGIKVSTGSYVILLNNDTIAEPSFVSSLLKSMKRHQRAFSCQAKMIQMQDHGKMDDAGNYYCAFGWAFADGKGRNQENYNTEKKIFSACAGAAIYRKKCWIELDFLTTSISRTWKIWTSVIAPDFMDMKTGIARKLWFIMWEAAPAVPDTTFSRCATPPEIIFI